MKTTFTRPWYHHATLYHIYPLSFADSNGDGFGDIKGIISHLDYLNDGAGGGLGVGAVWLSPIYVSPMADWGYDVADHMAIDPRFGTMADFDRLLKQVHRRGMKLLLDFVPNHTSNLHNWFLESRSAPINPRRDWYIWAEPAADGGPPNNWLSRFGGPSWTYDDATRQYYLHTFLPEQPDLNWRNPEVRKAMLKVLHFWLNKGVDGFRTDAVYALIKDAQLRDDPPNPNYLPGVSNPSDRLLRMHSEGQTELNRMIGSFCDVLEAANPDSYLLSEAYLDIPGLHHLYQACTRHPVHAPFNFNLMTLEWGARSFRGFIDQYEASMGPHDWPNYVLGNHDRHRLVSRVGERRARLLALLQLTLRGLPVVYNGEELGLSDGVISASKVRDPLELRVPGLGLGRDPERTPMPWNDQTDGGFTDGTPWLPMGSLDKHNNVELEERQPDSSLNLYRHLIALRSQSPALTDGDYRSIELGSPYVYGYIRETEQQRFIILLNFDQHHGEVMLKGPVGAWIAGTHEVEGDGQRPEGSVVRLKGYEGRVYELRKGEKL